RHDAPFATVVGARDEQNILQRDNQHQAPEYERYDTQDVVVIERQPVLGREGFFHCVQRAGANVAVHDTEGSEREYFRILLSLMTAQGLLRSHQWAAMWKRDCINFCTAQST